MNTSCPVNCGLTGGCSVCRPTQHMIISVPEPDRIGWECPVCRKGNAPHAAKCGHCADTPTATPPGWYGAVTIIPPTMSETEQ